jgi:hypothetical protein
VKKHAVLTTKYLGVIQWMIIAAVSVALILSPVTRTAGAQQPVWVAEFFPNTALTGMPIYTRSDSRIDFDWGGGAPAPGVPADGFSVRWTRTEWFDPGTYRFWCRSDDGFRLWVGELLVFDNWIDQQGGWQSRDLYLAAGSYPMRAEYYENLGGAVVMLNWERTAGGSGWQAEYFDNKNLNGSPVLRRTDTAIDFDWKNGSPANAVPADRFSVRWKQSLGFAAGTYRFLTSTDDGARVWVDNRLVIDAWYNQSLPNTRTGDITLNDGLHEIKVEYYEDGGQASAHVWWQRVEPYPIPGIPTSNAWRGEYYSNRDLIGGPALVRDDAAIYFDWSTSSPASWIPADNFSARWTRQLTFSPGYYRFSVQSDDGVRVWLDSGLVIDKWYPMANELHYVDGIYLSGQHQIKVEYFELTGFARIQFWFSPSGTPAQPTPTPAPNPAPAPALVPTVALVDNSSPGFVRGGATGAWRSAAVGYGGSLIWTWNNDYGRPGYNWGRWYPDLAPGRYEVSVYIPADYATTTNARYWVRHAEGYTLVRVDQSAMQGGWVSLGTYRFAGDDSEYVSLSDITYERYISRMLAWDAAKWEPR